MWGSAPLTPRCCSAVHRGGSRHHRHAAIQPLLLLRTHLGEGNPCSAGAQRPLGTPWGLPSGTHHPIRPFQVSLRDLRTFVVEHEFDAYSGSLSDFDVHGNLLVTCGFSSRMNGLACDRFLKVYDLRMMRATTPLQVHIDPFFLRFIPTYTSRLAIISQTGGQSRVPPGTPRVRVLRPLVMRNTLRCRSEFREGK